MIEIFRSHTYTWAHIGVTEAIFVGSCYDPNFTFGITSASTGSIFGKHPDDSVVVSLYEERIITYCRNGTWVPKPKCTGCNTIYVLLLK